MKSEVNTSGKRLQITRTFDAPRTVVFGWWSTAEKLQQWSGCKDAVRCEVEMDFRTGGSFTQKMQIAGCGEFTVTARYIEVSEPERIIYDADLGPATTRVTVEFFELGDQTKVVLTQEGFPDEFVCQTVSQGTRESLEKLTSLIAVPAAASHIAGDTLR
jgi:uncharacterized protein YndB with AHSA1/START domain